MEVAFGRDRIAAEDRAILIAGMNEQSLGITDLLAKVRRCLSPNADAAIDARWAKRRKALTIGIVGLATGTLGSR
jgi:hypothetical protein